MELVSQRSAEEAQEREREKVERNQELERQVRTEESEMSILSRNL